MVRVTLGALTTVLVLAAPVAADTATQQRAAAGQADTQTATRTSHGEARHSGTIVEIADEGRTIVLEEMLAWQGPDKPGIVHRSVRITPQTSIQLVERTGDWGTARTSLPGWDSKPMDAKDLRKGDFVTVTAADDARERAVALQVIRPEE